MHEPGVFASGGTVQASGGVYIRRVADDQILNLCLAGKYAHILTSRQMGKSSLMIATAQELRQRGARAVTIDLSPAGEDTTESQWYYWLALQIHRALGLSSGLEKWWRRQARLSAASRFTMLIESVMLKEIAEPVVIFLDEIDKMLEFPFKDDFFALVRSLHNARAENTELRRLSFVLIGSVAPAAIIKASARTPFNIGERVDLTDFTLAEASPLADRLGLPAQHSPEVLGWILKWTGGHPYLTVRLCGEVASSGRIAWTEEALDAVVAQTFFGSVNSDDHNLRYVQDMLTERAADKEAILNTYREIRRGRKVPDEQQSSVKAHLKLSGVVKNDDGHLRVRNRIYAAVFDDRWVREHLPRDHERLQRMAEQEAWRAHTQELEAERIRHLSLARQAAHDAEELRNRNNNELETSILLGLEAIRRLPRDAYSPSFLSGISILPPSRAMLSHESAVRAVAISPDGELIATASADPSVRLWEFKTGKLVTTLEHEGRVTHISFGSTGKLLFSYGLDRTARIWNLEKWQHVPLKHPTRVIAAAISRGDMLCTACESGNCYLWSSTGEAIPLALKLAATPNSIAFSPDGTLIAAGCDDGCAYVHEIGSHTKYPFLHRGPVLFVVFSPDGSLLGSASWDRTARIWETSTGQEISLLACGDAVTCMAFSPVSSSLIATGSRDNTARIWNRATSANLPLRHEGTVSTVVFSPDGRHLVSASEDNTARVWEVETGEEVARMCHQHEVQSVTVHPSGSFVVTGSSDRTAQVWALPAGPETISFAHRDIAGFAFSRNGRLVTCGGDRKAILWDLKTKSRIAEFEDAPDVDCVAITENGRLLAAAGKSGKAVVWDTKARSTVTTVTHDRGINSLAFSPDGRVFATAGNDGTARLWRVASGEEIARFDHTVTPLEKKLDFRRDVAISKALEQPGADEELSRTPARLLEIWCVAFSPDGSAIATGSNDNCVRIWKVGDEEPVDESTHPAPVRAVVFSPQGHQVAAGCDDRAVHFWNLREQSKVRLAEPGAVRSVAFSADGTYVASGSSSTVRVWNLATGTEIANYKERFPVVAVGFTPGMKYVASACENEVRLRLWRPRDMVAAASRLVSRNLTRDEWRQYFGEERYRKTCAGIR